MPDAPDLLQAFLDDIVAHPDDPSLWLILADWLEDQQDPRAELVRLTWQLQYEPSHTRFRLRQARVQELIAGGMLPVRPTRTLDGMTFAWVAPGSFQMGSPKRESGRRDDEQLHRVRLTRGFWMGIHPVTQGQWRDLMDNNPSSFTRRRGKRVAGLSDADLELLPVDSVSWDASCEFCTRLGQRIGQVVRLPTEAEWEYACRAGTRSSFSFGDSPNRYPDYAILSDTGRPPDTRPDPVGRRKPNAWGLYDMHGNILEWCAEALSPYPSGKGECVDPVGPATGRTRVVRGGTWHFVWNVCRSATRVSREVEGTSDTGLRVCFTPEVSGTAPR
jgi:uncharacterized protein (TIGR02996 family)